MTEVPLYGAKAAGRVALVSPEDYPLVTPYRWNVWEDERAHYDGGPYAIAHIWREGKRTTVMMHSLIMPDWAEVDHKNFNGLDNRRENLRDGTTGNTHNQRPRDRGTSQYKGVHWHKPSAKWWARITYKGKTRSLGLYIDEKKAAQAYNQAAIKLFGEYAYLNVID